VKVCIFQSWGGIGDLCMTVPVIHQIRATHPSASFVVVVKGPAQAALLNSAPYVSKILHFPDERNLHGLLRFFWSLRRMHLDAIFISTGTRAFYAILIYLLCNIRVRIGDGLKYRFAYTHNYTKPLPIHRVDRQLSMVELWTGSPTTLDLSLPIDPVAATAAATILESNNLIDRQFLVIHPGSNKGEDMRQKRIPIELALQTARVLSRESKIKIVIILGPDDLDLEDRFHLNDKDITVIARVSLDETKYILSKASGFIGSDSSLGHIASAFDVPTVTLIGPTNPIVSLPRGRGAKIVQSNEAFACRPCWFTPLQGKCPHSLRCLTTIKVEDVVEAANVKIG